MEIIWISERLIQNTDDETLMKVKYLENGHIMVKTRLEIMFCSHFALTLHVNKKSR